MAQEHPTKSKFNATAALELLNAEALLLVNLAVSCFAHAVSPPNSSDAHIAYNSPTLFSSSSIFRADYNLWLSLPVPSAPQLITLHDILVAATCESPGTQLSIGIISGSRTVYAPAWVLNLWPCLRTLIQHSEAWFKASKSLEKGAKSGGTGQNLALELISCLTTLPLDSLLPGFLHLQTLDLPNLLCNEWLLDEHINAGGEFINAHPNCKPNIRVLSSFFLRTLHLAFQCSATWSPRHPILIDLLVSSGTVNQLLIPINLPNHWAFIFVDLSLQTYSYIVTLALAQISVSQTCISLIDQWLFAIFSLKFALAASPQPFPPDLQLDGHSCGVAVLSNMAAYAIPGSNQFPMWTQVAAAEHCLQWGINYALPSIHLTGPVGPFALDVNLEDLVEDDFNVGALFNDFKELVHAPDHPITSSVQFPVHTTQLKQCLLPFKPITREERRAQESKRLEAHQIESKADQDRQQLSAIQDMFTRCERKCLHKQVQRERKRAARQAAGLKPFSAPSNSKACNDYFLIFYLQLILTYSERVIRFPNTSCSP